MEEEGTSIRRRTPHASVFFARICFHRRHCLLHSVVVNFALSHPLYNYHPINMSQGRFHTAREPPTMLGSYTIATSRVKSSAGHNATARRLSPKCPQCGWHFFLTFNLPSHHTATRDEKGFRNRERRDTSRRVLVAPPRHALG